MSSRLTILPPACNHPSRNTNPLNSPQINSPLSNVHICQPDCHSTCFKITAPLPILYCYLKVIFFPTFTTVYSRFFLLGILFLKFLLCNIYISFPRLWLTYVTKFQVPFHRPRLAKRCTLQTANHVSKPVAPSHQGMVVLKKDRKSPLIT